MNLCHLCRSASVADLLDCGPQPISNRFLASPTDAEFRHRIMMGQCEACGLVQLMDPPPAEELRPRYEWITYNEPEGHLDQLADRLADLPGLSPESTICGVSFKDDSTLARMKERGFRRVWRIDPEADLGIKEPGAGVEMVQDRLDPQRADNLARTHGKSDVIVARQILEHAHDTLGFMEALRRLVTPQGYIVIEVPDCSRGLDKKDYSTVWEEHVVYFTPETFARCFGFGGFLLLWHDRFPYSLEDSLVGVAQPAGQNISVFPPTAVLETERQRARSFATGLASQSEKFRNFFNRYAKNRNKIALFGAGHLACTFVNLLSLKDYFEFVVDDHPNKTGLFMPGSRLPIRNSASLVKDGIKLCLLSLNPDSEEKVMQKNQEFLARGGVFSSIFQVSKYGLQI